MFVEHTNLLHMLHDQLRNKPVFFSDEGTTLKMAGRPLMQKAEASRSAL